MVKAISKWSYQCVAYIDFKWRQKYQRLTVVSDCNSTAVEVFPYSIVLNVTIIVPLKFFEQIHLKNYYAKLVLTQWFSMLQTSVYTMDFNVANNQLLLSGRKGSIFNLSIFFDLLCLISHTNY